MFFFSTFLKDFESQFIWAMTSGVIAEYLWLVDDGAMGPSFWLSWIPFGFTYYLIFKWEREEGGESESWFSLMINDPRLANWPRLQRLLQRPKEGCTCREWYCPYHFKDKA